MYYKFHLSLFTLLLTVYGYGQHSLEKMAFLEGTWQVENKDQFEKWEISEDQYLSGQTFSVKNGIKTITEHLKINTDDGKIIYYATVFAQNEGRTIPFILDEKTEDKFSFQNLSHDFPKTITYRKLSNDTLYVEVAGEEGEGFAYKLIRSQAPKTIPDWFMEDLKNNIGVWKTKEIKERKDDDPFVAYGMDYQWGIGKTSIIGRLFGVKEEGETQDLWQFRHYWDSVKEKGVVVQYGNWGIVGFGYVKPIDRNIMESLQTFSLTDGRTWEVKHIVEMHGTHFISTSYEKDEADQWEESGSWTWYKQEE